MPYRAPVTDITFCLDHIVGFDRVQAASRFEDATSDVVQAILTEAGRICEEVLAPLNRAGDLHPARLENGVVRTSPGFAEGYRAIAEAGFVAISADPAHGGLGLPHTVTTAVNEMMGAACLSLELNPLMTQGQIEALEHHATDAIKDLYLPRLVSGDWCGTMNLTEPQAGSDVGALTTRAVPNGDGTYAVTGQKIYISWGDNDFAGNIVHLVLARLPDAPPGTKGISTFIVPKRKVSRDGSVGEANAVRCGAIEHKMGIHGSATCVMNFDGAEGYLIGPANKGLMVMFAMMNSARLAVGIQGLGMIDRAYQGALAYARDRLQMRAASGPKFPDKPADPIIVHPDVRRMLLTCKAFAEGGRLLAYHAATLVDVLEQATDTDEKRQADDLLSFLTPVVKACLTEWGVECSYHALQCFGGHGYVREWGMEQLARDARITTIYEGTTQIQALDLLGRKVLQTHGPGLRQFGAMIEAFCTEHAGNAALAEFIGPLAEKAKELATLTLEIGSKATRDPEEIGAAAVDYLFHTGYVVLAYWWARAVATSAAGNYPAAFKAAKRDTARFYYARILPRTMNHAVGIRAGAASLMALDADNFDS